MKYYVNCNVKRNGDGSADHPFKKISYAAAIAQAGDMVIVSPGIYRESVNPVNAGTKEARIEYRSEVDKAAVITGAEEIKNWQKYKENVWRVKIPNAFFGAFNPYTTLVSGDWFVAKMIAHTGDVYLDHKSLYEVTELERVLHPVKSDISWDADFSVFTWYTEQDKENDETVIYANFGHRNPNEENVEISVRKNCFYPEKEGINYITLSGFTVREAATQWAPPTAYQEGMIGPHWSKGWIIEDCEVYESKCSGISLGKYLQKDNDNKWLKYKYKDGTQTERDCICQAQREGWTKERIGSHIIRRCNIHDCGQTGIVGHLGGVFSIIEDNEIHHINNKQNLAGAEIGGIKMHAAIDVIIRHNHIYNCTRGLWLDWQAQGTRVTQNLFHDNCLPVDSTLNEKSAFAMGEDIFVEVSHGPTLIDRNILLSDCALKYASQGAAVVHNLIAGSLTAVGRGVSNGALSKISPRYTPYHVQHRTEIAGFMTILHGDMRFFNNVFVQKDIRPELKKIADTMKDSEWTDGNLITGTIPYEGYPSEEEFKSQFEGYCGMGAEPSDRYYNPLPVWAEGNVYFNGAKPMSTEKAVIDNEHKITLELVKENGHCILKTNLGEYLPQENCRMITTETLGQAFEPEERFENPDGSEIIFNKDFFDNNYEMHPSAGPFADYSSLKLF